MSDIFDVIVGLLKPYSGRNELHDLIAICSKGDISFSTQQEIDELVWRLESAGVIDPDNIIRQPFTIKGIPTYTSVKIVILSSYYME